jgi:predicted RNase H-like HicB family nuclease
MATYQITLHIERLAEGPYLGTSPNLPGLIVQADTAEGVIRIAPEIAHDLIEVMHALGQPMPAGLVPLEEPETVCLTVPA